MDQQTKELIENNINTNEVCLFMKGTPDAPECGFSMAVANMLKILEVNFKSVNVLSDQSIREGIKKFSEWPTVPQLYVKKEFVGGCDIVKEMFENGELKKLFEDKQNSKPQMRGLLLNTNYRSTSSPSNSIRTHQLDKSLISHVSKSTVPVLLCLS